MPRFHLPFDGHRPVLICGHSGTGKTSLLRHLMVGQKTSRPVYVIDPDGSCFDVPGITATVLRPEDETTDVAFFEAATALVLAAQQTPGATLIIDEYMTIAAPYSVPVPAQQEFLDTLDVALRTMRTKQGRILVASSRIPDRKFTALFGSRFLMGHSTPIDWMLMFGSTVEMTPSEHRVGGGVLRLDGHSLAMAFPYLDAEQPTP